MGAWGRCGASPGRLPWQEGKRACRVYQTRLFPKTLSLVKGEPRAFVQDRASGYAVSGTREGWRIGYGGVDDLVLAPGDMLAAGKPAPACRET